MERSRDRGFCCGAGGGSYWWTVPEREKISHLRLEQARSVGAETLATACPFCLAMLEDASRAVGGPRVADLAELVAAALPGSTGK
jgi:Fe-S oxidoreductase